jgi:DNA-binding transcriptional LysR family regulator
MDRLMALQAFARVVELGGFTKAGDSLQMSKTTVSDLVQSLEKHLGVRLLQRTTRRVTVSADGAAFYERCAQILADLDEAEASVMQSRVAPKGRLRSICPVRSRGFLSFHNCRRSSAKWRVGTIEGINPAHVSCRFRHVRSAEMH